MKLHWASFLPGLTSANVLSHSYHRARAGRQRGQGPAPAQLPPGYSHAVWDQGQSSPWAVGGERVVKVQCWVATAWGRGICLPIVSY